MTNKELAKKLREHHLLELTTEIKMMRFGKNLERIKFIRVPKGELEAEAQK